MKFVTNNFAAILDNQSAPDQFHRVQDFLRASPIGYALIQPESISTGAVIQIWSTAEIEEGTIKFTHAEQEYVITPDVVREALHLPQVNSSAPLYPDDEIKAFIESLGYNGDTSKLGKLVRAKLRKEWNFYFDCITKCFTNKSSNFDALTQTAQQIGYCLFQNTNFDFASIILEYICMRINDKRKVIYFSRFLHLIFVHLCPDSVFQNDTCIKVHKNGPRSFVDMTNKDVKNQFNTPIVYPEQFMALLQARMPDKYGARVQDSTVRTHPESNPSTHPKHSSKQLAPSGSSQKVPVAKRRRFKLRANKKKSNLRDETSEESTIPEATETAIPDERPQEVTKEAGIPITKIVDGGTTADKDSDSEDNMPISFCVKRRLEEPSIAASMEIPMSPQTKRLKDVTNETLVRLGLAEADAAIPDGSTNPDGPSVPDATATPDANADATNVITVDETFSSPVQRIDQQQDKMAESERKRKAEEDLSAIKVYKKQKTRRNLSPVMDTQEPGTQSVSDIHLSPAMDPQEPGTQSVSDIHQVEIVSTDAAAQGANPDKAANTDEGAIPDQAANPDEGANPDKGATPDEGTTHAKEATPDASPAAQMATQEPFTQSVKESQATQEPPTQREPRSWVR